jgi:hypothetical protein
MSQDMSTILVKSTSEQTLSMGRYFIAELESGKHSIVVCVNPTGLRVIVQNASNRAWRGMGKLYANLDAALAAYKTGEIRSMIAMAVELSKGGMQ